MKNKNLLMIAYACESDKGSEPAVGWNWLVQASALVNMVYLVTRKNNVKSITEGIDNLGIENIEIIESDLPNVILKLKKKFGFTRIYYILWQFITLKKIRNLINKNKINIDFIHHTTFVNDYIPSVFFMLKKPFIWGPIGSNEVMPQNIIENKKKVLLEKIKHISKKMFKKFNPFYKFCYKNTKAIICINENISNEVRKRFKGEVFVIPAVGINKDDIKINTDNISNEIKILSVGRFIKQKNFHITLRAFYEFNKIYPESHLTIVGEGPLEKEILKLIDLLRIDNKVTLKKWLNKNELQLEFNKNSMFIFPSIEAAGFVTLEAMANGLPVVGLNKGGIKQFCPVYWQVCLEKTDSIESVCERLSSKMSKIINDYEKNSQKALQYSNKYTWESKRESIKEVYNSVWR